MDQLPSTILGRKTITVASPDRRQLSVERRLALRCWLRLMAMGKAQGPAAHDVHARIKDLRQAQDPCSAGHFRAPASRGRGRYCMLRGSPPEWHEPGVILNPGWLRSVDFEFGASSSVDTQLNKVVVSLGEAHDAVFRAGLAPGQLAMTTEGAVALVKLMSLPRPGYRFCG